MQFNSKHHDIKRNRVKHVVLVARWAALIEARESGEQDTLLIDSTSPSPDLDRARGLLSQSLALTLEELHKIHATVWIVKQVPLQERAPFAAWS